jgi:glycosyltransferase involved in cell wall biosynthesis
MIDRVESVSVILPARNEARRIAETVAAVYAEARALDVRCEVVVVDDGSTDDTGHAAAQAGAHVVRLEGGGNPGAARNRGAEMARGDVLIFLDADCTPSSGWLEAIVDAIARGESCVGGSLALPDGLPLTARWDYYGSTYHLHPARPAGPVPNHTPANIAVLRGAFEATRGFTEAMPVAHGHEELAWQADLARLGLRCFFEPRAVAYHHNRPGLGNMLRRSYRWGYSAVQAKAESRTGRWQRAYDHPWLLVWASMLTAPIQIFYVTWCWMRAGQREPIAALPVVLLARVAYAAGMTIGGAKWLLSAPTPPR